MGRPMTMNLLNAGYPVFIHSRRKESCRKVPGALMCDSPRSVAEQAMVVFICVSSASDVEQVIYGEKGIIEGARPGTVIVDMTTISADATRQIAMDLTARGFHVLDAPVTGGEIAAIGGNLAITVGGRADIFERVRPYFEKMGKHITHIGDSGAGQVAKACNQLVIGVTLEAVAEALLLAERSGVDGKRVRDALMLGPAASKVLETTGKKMLEGDYTPGITATLHRYDIEVARATAYDLGLVLPTVDLFALHLDAVIQAGDGALDSSAVLKALRHLAVYYTHSAQTTAQESPTAS